MNVKILTSSVKTAPKRVTIVSIEVPLTLLRPKSRQFYYGTAWTSEESCKSSGPQQIERKRSGLKVVKFALGKENQLFRQSESNDLVNP